MTDNRQIFTLKQVTSSIQKVIEDRYKNQYWVKAEMHKLNLYPSGHCFPELLQKENGKIVAQMNASIWKHNYQRINQNFVKIVKEPLREDTTLLLLVKISFHETFGLSLQIMDIDPNYSLGELQKERQETLLKLQKEGIINQNQQLDFPLLPKRIALISAETSKGLSDFRKVIETNQWGYQFFTFLFPSYLQGDVAVNSIINQLEKIQKVQQHFDVVVIVRGGGGEVGLSCYNNYELCKAIATFPLPVLTGIGHSTNLTVAEMIAYRNAITPTELGDFLLQSFHDFSMPLKDASKLIKSFASKLIEQTNTALTTQSKFFKNSTKYVIQEAKNDLTKLSSNTQAKVKLAIQKEEENLFFSRKLIKKSVKDYSLNQKAQTYQLIEQLQKGSKNVIKSFDNDIENKKLNLPKSIQRTVQDSRTSIQQMEHTVKLVDPQNVLKRGYSITLIDGKLVADLEELKTGQTIQTTTFQGTIESQITRLNKRSDGERD